MEFYERIRAVQNLTPDCTYSIDCGLLNIQNFLEEYNVDLNPDYQRDFVWTVEQKKKFVGFVIQNHKGVQPLWFNNFRTKKGMWGSVTEVVDGKQRISAILEWIAGDYEAVCPCGEEFWHKDIDEIGARNLKISTTLRMQFVNLKRQDLLKFYLLLNSGGTIHTKEEINKIKKLLETEQPKEI